MKVNHFGYETRDRAMIEYAIRLLREKGIDPMKITKDEDAYVTIFVKDAAFTPKLCEEVWFKMQKEFCIDLPRILIDTDAFCWDSCGAQDLSTEFIDPIVEEKFIMKDCQEELEKISSKLLAQLAQACSDEKERKHQDIELTLQDVELALRNLRSLPFLDTLDSGVVDIDNAAFTDKVA